MLRCCCYLKIRLHTEVTCEEDTPYVGMQSIGCAPLSFKGVKFMQRAQNPVGGYPAIGGPTHCFAVVKSAEHDRLDLAFGGECLMLFGTDLTGTGQVLNDKTVIRT
jgi:hypothetical protein